MSGLAHIDLDYDVHRQQAVVTISFKYDIELIELVKRIEGTRWSSTRGVWYIPEDQFDLRLFYKTFRGVAWLDYSKIRMPEKDKEDTARKPGYNLKLIKTRLSHHVGEEIRQFKRWMEQKRYSGNTINTYIHMLEIFFGFYHEKAPTDLGVHDIFTFNNDFIVRNNLSYTFQNQILSALKKFYLQQYGRDLDTEGIERPRRSRPLPRVISRKDLQAFFNGIRNVKHRIAFETIYAYGLRRSELLNLKLEHIDRNRGLLLILDSKGKKDRVIPISSKWLAKADAYFQSYDPQVYFIEGRYPGRSISAASLQKVFDQTLRKSGISRHYTIHCLRHSYATHLLENGTDLRYIQELLGHKSSRTTEIYTHVSNKSLMRIKNPFDEL